MEDVAIKIIAWLALHGYDVGTDTAGYFGDGTAKTLGGIVTYDGFHHQ